MSGVRVSEPGRLTASNAKATAAAHFIVGVEAMPARVSEQSIIDLGPRRHSHARPNSAPTRAPPSGRGCAGAGPSHKPHAFGIIASPQALVGLRNRA